MLFYHTEPGSTSQVNKVGCLILALIIGLVGLTSCGGAGGLGPVGHVVPYTDKSITVEPFKTLSWTINMSRGAVFEGHLTVRGGNDDIRFYIKDPYGNRVLDIDRVHGRYDFYYRATNEGFHTFYLDNSFSLITRKQVYIHYRVR